MTSVDLPIILQELTSASLTFYAAYWAFVIRKASSVPLYRNQALGIILIALASAVGAISFALGGGTGGNLFNFVLVVAGIIFTLYWVDASLVAGRRSDPLMRDTIRWSRMRLVLWPTNFILAAAGILLSWPIFVQAFLTYGVGALGLTLAGRRSGDPTLRRHLKWFGLYVAFDIGFFVLLGLAVSGTVSLNSPAATALLPALFAVTFAYGYSLYRSATSLVPLRPLPEGVRLQGS